MWYIYFKNVLNSTNHMENNEGLFIVILLEYNTTTYIKEREREGEIERQMMY